MIAEKKPVTEIDEGAEPQTEVVNVKDQWLQNVVKLVIMMLLTYIVIFM